MMSPVDVPREWVVWMLSPNGELTWWAGGGVEATPNLADAARMSADEAVGVVGVNHALTILEGKGPPVWAQGLFPLRELERLRKARP